MRFTIQISRVSIKRRFDIATTSRCGYSRCLATLWASLRIQENLRQRTNRDGISNIKQVSHPRILVRHLIFRQPETHKRELPVWAIRRIRGAFGQGSEPGSPTWFVFVRYGRENAIRVRLWSRPGQDRTKYLLSPVEASMCR